MTIFVDPSRAKQYECTICFEIYKEPVQIGCEEHVFCKECVEQISTHGSSFHCPLCRTKCRKNNVTRVGIIERQINSLKVKCQNSTNDKSLAIGISNNNNSNSNSVRRSKRIKQKAEKEIDNNASKKRKQSFENINPNKKRKLNENESFDTCEWEGIYSDLDSHIKRCPLQSMQCKHCTDTMLRKELTKHNKICPKYPMQCIQCRKTRICRNEMTNHTSKYCPMTLINCDECKQEIKRKDTKLHLRSECPESLIKCAFSQFGCKEKLKRKNERNHIESATFTHNHLVQISTRQLKLEKTVNSFKKENKELSKTVNSLNRRIAALERTNGQTNTRLNHLENKIPNRLCRSYSDANPVVVSANGTFYRARYCGEEGKEIILGSFSF